MPHAEGEKDDMFRPIGEAVEAVGGEAVQTDEPQVVDNIGSYAPNTRTHTGADGCTESLCMSCHEQGNTRLLLTQIPFFREVVLMSFECPHCGFKNCEVQSASEIQPRGCSYTLRVESVADLDRQLVKADSCLCRFVQLDIEIPPQRGQLTTVEGLLATVLDDLAGGQAARREQQPDAWQQIEAFLARGRDVLAGSRGLPFTLIVDDPAGNSWIEPRPDDARGKCERRDYERSPAQNERLGLTDTSASEPGHGRDPDHDQKHKNGGDDDDDNPIRPDEVHTFPATCPSCVRPCNTHMKMVEIPHFREVVIMSTVCDACGYKSNEVKTGGAMPARGRIITLRVEDAEDLARDILKSETCGLRCPELNLDLTPGTLGGRFTTVEGLLAQVHDELHQRIFADDAGASDSLEAQTRERWRQFFAGLRDARDGRKTFTCILDDPLAASYVQNLCAPDPDPQLTIEDVDRTAEQDEDLGISDMVTEGYQVAERADKADGADKAETAGMAAKTAETAKTADTTQTAETG